ncbi:MAG: hypothetical protein ACI9ND_000173 [Yoonia sp.]|jgi:hypothetical protein
MRYVDMIRNAGVSVIVGATYAEAIAALRPTG